LEAEQPAVRLLHLLPRLLWLLDTRRRVRVDIDHPETPVEQLGAEEIPNVFGFVFGHHGQV